MNRTWLTILNKIINSETEKISIEVKHYDNFIKLKINKKG